MARKVLHHEALLVQADGTFVEKIQQLFPAHRLVSRAHLRNEPINLRPDATWCHGLERLCVRLAAELIDQPFCHSDLGHRVAIAWLTCLRWTISRRCFFSVTTDCRTLRRALNGKAYKTNGTVVCKREQTIRNRTGRLTGLADRRNISPAHDANFYEGLPNLKPLHRGHDRQGKRLSHPTKREQRRQARNKHLSTCFSLLKPTREQQHKNPRKRIKRHARRYIYIYRTTYRYPTL